MATAHRSSAPLIGVLALLLLAAALVFPGALLGQEPGARQRVNPRAVADSFAYRIATFSPASGPPGTLVSVRWQYLPAITPIRLGVGAQRVGFEVLREILTDRTGEFTDTIRVPAWAEANRPHMLVVLDFYFRPLAVSSAFQVTNPDGTLSRDGRLMESDGKCAVLQAEGGEFYFLSGDMGAVKPGERVVVDATLGDRSMCDAGEREITLKVSRVRRPFGSTG